VQRVGHTATLLEWDDSIPTFREVHNEALKANRFLAKKCSGPRRMRLAGMRPSGMKKSFRYEPVGPPTHYGQGADANRLTPAENMNRRAPNGEPMARYAARFIKPNDRLTSFERLEIYNRQYWWRLMACMADDFPGLQAVLGNRRFEALSKAYLVDCPSHSFTLRNLGRDLEAWMKKNPAGPVRGIHCA